MYDIHDRVQSTLVFMHAKNGCVCLRAMGSSFFFLRIKRRKFKEKNAKVQKICDRKDCLIYQQKEKCKSVEEVQYI